MQEAGNENLIIFLSHTKNKDRIKKDALHTQRKYYRLLTLKTSCF